MLSLPLNLPQIWRAYFVSVWHFCSIFVWNELKERVRMEIDFGLACSIGSHIACSFAYNFSLRAIISSRLNSQPCSNWRQSTLNQNILSNQCSRIVDLWKLLKGYLITLLSLNECDSIKQKWSVTMVLSIKNTSARCLCCEDQVVSLSGNDTFLLRWGSWNDRNAPLSWVICTWVVKRV